MTVFGVLASLGIGATLAGAGAFLLGRRPRSQRDWNEAFLTGGAAASALLFPLSAAFPGGALWILVVCVLVVAAVAVSLPRTGGEARPPTEASARFALRRMHPVDAFLVLFVAGAVVVFVAANGRYQLLWDGLFIWATKGMLLLDSGGLTRELWEGSDIEGRVGRTVGYPPLVPLLHALVGAARGGFQFDAAKPVFAFFFLSLLSGTWSAARALLPARRALVVVALVAALPVLSTSWAAGGYADMPQAAVLVTLVGALLAKENDGPSWRQPVPWLFGALVSVKSEGTLLAVLLLAAWALAAILENGLAGAVRATRRRAGALMLVATFLALRILYVRWTIAPEIDRVYRPVNLSTIALALERLPVLGGLVAAEMARVRVWGLLWPAFFAAVVVLVRRRDPAQRVLAAATFAAVGAYVSTFLFTATPLVWHVGTALDRILSQLAPLAVLVAVLGLTPPEEVREA